MADYETTLHLLSERGNPVGAEELIERVTAELAGDPLVVLAKRREGRPMTKTTEPPTTKPRNRYRGPAMGAAAFAVILALAGIYYFTAQLNDDNVANPVPPAGTTDLETIEAGVAAVYSGDADRAVELFELETNSYGDDQPITDQYIRDVAAYQKGIGGRLTLSCTELGTPGEFNCRMPYHNAMTDAVGFNDLGDINRVVVKDGVITTFGFPEHSGMQASMAAYLALELGSDVPEECHQLFSPFPESCVAAQIGNLDGWVTFDRSVWPAHSESLLAELEAVWESALCRQGTVECDRAQWQVLATWAQDQN